VNVLVVVIKHSAEFVGKDIQRQQGRLKTPS
jgi:hypothetical protein